MLSDHHIGIKENDVSEILKVIGVDSLARYVRVGIKLYLNVSKYIKKVELRKMI